VDRRAIDLLITGTGAVVIVALLAAGGLGLWAASFTNSNVHSQLAKQDITFPSKAAFAHPVPGTEITPSMIPSVSMYAGDQLLTGPEAKAWADDFIAVHLSEMPYGGVYDAVSTASRAAPTNKALAAEVTTSFEGTTLRGLLLEAYAFSVFGEVATWAAIGAFILAGLMAILVVLGFLHARKEEPSSRALSDTTATS
jgi:hypothetical protein